MRILMLATIACALLLTSCHAPVEFDPEDPVITAEIQSILAEAMEGSRNVDADRALAMAEGEGELTFITGDVMLSGLEYIREIFRDTYAGIESQDHTVI